MGSFIVQSSHPQIKLYHIDENSCYYEFSATSENGSGKNLQNYSFQRSIKTITGSFSMTVKESPDIPDSEKFLNKVKTFDVVEIYENESLDFRGVITSVSYTADASSLSRNISIQGKSIMYLLESLNLNTELTAMVLTGEGIQTEAEEITLRTETNKGTEVKIKEALTTIYNVFCKVINNNKKLANSGLIAYIKKWIGSDFINIPADMKFYLPLITSFFSRDIVTYPDYIRNFLDPNVYEMYEIIRDGKVYLRIRDCPFDSDDWSNITNQMTILSSSLVSYTISKSIDEVYTSFYANVEGSSLSPEYFLKAGDSSVTVTNEKKTAIYGYKPLRVTFTGYTTASKVINSEKFQKLAARVSKWYDHMDEFYNGTITILNLKNQEKATIGGKLSFLDGEFYITGEDHQWSYGTSPKIIYHVERGGKYSASGNFSELKNISRNIAELEKSAGNAVTSAIGKIKIGSN